MGTIPTSVLDQNALDKLSYDDRIELLYQLQQEEAIILQEAYYSGTDALTEKQKQALKPLRHQAHDIGMNLQTDLSVSAKLNSVDFQHDKRLVVLATDDFSDQRHPVDHMSKQDIGDRLHQLRVAMGQKGRMQQNKDGALQRRMRSLTLKNG